MLSVSLNKTFPSFINNKKKKKIKYLKICFDELEGQVDVSIVTATLDRAVVVAVDDAVYRVVLDLGVGGQGVGVDPALVELLHVEVALDTPVCC